MDAGLLAKGRTSGNTGVFMSDATAIPDVIEGKKELKGIEGWLALRIFGYVIVGPIQFVAVPSLPGFALTAILFIAGIYLYRGKPVGVKLAKIGEGITISIGVFLLAAVPFATSIGMSAAELIHLGVPLLLGGIIWYAYFCKSLRVRNTYFPEAAEVPASAKESAYEREQRLAKTALRNAALAAVTQALKIGVITRAQAALIEANMKDNRSLRKILEELITTLEANGETAHAAVIRELDVELFKGCVSAAQLPEGQPCSQ
jgi:hypothetical protein